MTLLEIAQTATALSLLVAAATFITTQIARSKTAKQERILRWQRVVIFDLVKDGLHAFDDIRVSYLAAAQQYSGAKLPKSELQDSTLRLIFMELLGEELILLTDEGEYVPRTARNTLDEDLFKQAAIQQFRKTANKPKLTSTIYETLDRESGVYNIDSLYRKVNADGLGFSFEEFNVEIREMVARGIVVIEKDRLWLRAKVPPRTTQTPKQ
jgi:hypothetical protein